MVNKNCIQRHGRIAALVFIVTSQAFLKAVYLLEISIAQHIGKTTLKASESRTATLPTNSSLFRPEQVLEQYLEWNGDEALRKQPGKRQFAVVYYHCPHRAGNALHTFLNSVIWAIITNRTLLWRYDEKSARNTVADCDQYLERAPWMPSFDEWSANLSLPAPVPVKMNTLLNWKHARLMNTTWHVFSYEEQRQSLKEPVVTFPRFRDWVDKKDLLTSRIRWNDDPRELTLNQPFFSYWYYKRAPHVESKGTRQLMTDLYAEGLSFLYGMLLRRTFRIKATDDLPHRERDTGGISIALHSRHSHVEWDGSDVRDEIRCFDQLLPASATGGLNCTVYMMSDRQATLGILGEWLRQRGCCIVTAQHTSSIQQGEFGWLPEMGPFGGAVRASLL
jgi:hypothetical protein